MNMDILHISWISQVKSLMKKPALGFLRPHLLWPPITEKNPKHFRRIIPGRGSSRGPSGWTSTIINQYALGEISFALRNGPATNHHHPQPAVAPNLRAVHHLWQ
jgi:hypothetical protein